MHAFAPSLSFVGDLWVQHTNTTRGREKHTHTHIMVDGLEQPVSPAILSIFMVIACIDKSVSVKVSASVSVRRRSLC